MAEKLFLEDVVDVFLDDDVLSVALSWGYLLVLALCKL